jgi:cell division protein FtsZ
VLGSRPRCSTPSSAANDVLQGAVQGIAELITRPGPDQRRLRRRAHRDVRDGHGDDGHRRRHRRDRAREAAEAAISSPLLEDINLAGANGILVNVTAGMDLSIGEFEEVGNTIKEFASDDATVVVGTVIDPEMSDEIRVTVVATGLGTSTGATVMRGTVANEAEESAPGRPDDYRADYLDIPAFLRRQAD